MSDSALYCCGRPMTVIGVDRDGRPDVTGTPVGVRLHSCPGCGRHSWRRGGREVDRAELLETLRPPERPRPAAGRRPAGSARPSAEPPAAAEEPAPTPEQERTARREELQRMLAGFQVHGSAP